MWYISYSVPRELPRLSSGWGRHVAPARQIVHGVEHGLARGPEGHAQLARDLARVIPGRPADVRSQVAARPRGTAIRVQPHQQIPEGVVEAPGWQPRAGPVACLAQPRHDLAHRDRLLRAQVAARGRRHFGGAHVGRGHVADVHQTPREADDRRVHALHQIHQDLVRRVDGTAERRTHDDERVHRHEVERRPLARHEIPRRALGQRLRQVVRVAIERGLRVPVGFGQHVIGIRLVGHRRHRRRQHHALDAAARGRTPTGRSASPAPPDPPGRAAGPRRPRRTGWPCGRRSRSLPRPSSNAPGACRSASTSSRPSAAPGSAVR